MVGGQKWSFQAVLREEQVIRVSLKLSPLMLVQSSKFTKIWNIEEIYGQDFAIHVQDCQMNSIKIPIPPYYWHFFCNDTFSMFEEGLQFLLMSRILRVKLILGTYSDNDKFSHNRHKFFSFCPGDFPNTTYHRDLYEF